MPKFELADAAIQELTLVFATDPQTGAEYAPRNPAAKVLSVKGGEKPSLLARFADTVKAYFAEPLEPGQYPVTQAADDVDGDGDGPADYNALVYAVCSLYSDLSQCCGISDDGTRSIAIKTALDCFLSELKTFLGDGAQKAGKRHSAADQARLDDIDAHLKKAQDHVAAAQEAHQALMSSAKDPAGKKDDSNEDDLEDEQGKVDGNGAASDAKAAPVSIAVDIDTTDAKAALVELESLAQRVNAEIDKAKNKDGDDKPYGDVEYADPKNGKYPIDTAEHARAAWDYINQEKNADKYDADELAEIKSRIRAACKKFGIEISDDKAAPVADDTAKAGEIDMTQEQIDELVAKAAQSAAEAAVKATTEALQPKIDEAAKAAEAAKAEADAAKAEAAATAEKARQVGIDARKPSVPSAGAPIENGGESRLQRAVKAALAENPQSPRI